MTRPSDSLEQIVADAIEREKQINRDHPERHGYGMVDGEANDLIHRIEHLEHNQLRAQAVKVRNRKDRIRVIGKDKLYTHSPEEIVIEKLDREQISRAENKVLNTLPKRSQEFYFLKEIGEDYSEIAKRFNIHRTTVSRDLKRTEDLLRKEFTPIYNKKEKRI